MAERKFDFRSPQAWFSLLMLLVVAVLVVAWIVQRERLPGEIRIAAGPSGSLYHTFAAGD